MKKSILLLLTATAFISATAFTYLIKRNSTIYIQQNTIVEKKRIALGCSPSYIPGADESIPPLSGWGNYSWKISTTSDSAQFYFNQGINMYYAFHIIESRASFEKSARFDPSNAMVWWGKALAFGPNINDFGYQRPSEAFASAMKANELKSSSSPVEKALIEAMSIRYSSDTTADQKKLNEKYRDAMANVYHRYKNNADVVALYADALMLIHPWDLYNHDYTPKPWTPQIVSVLKEALKLSPAHPGAHHYFIHAVEASANPQQALKSADFLSTAMPHVSHVTHMPSHIYIRSGYYNKGINLNDKAVEGYKTYLNAFLAVAENLPLYSLHNLHMKMACAHMAGNFKEALSAAIDLQKEIPPFFITMEGPLGHYVQYLHQSPLITYIRFGKWNEILKEEVQDSLQYTPVLQHFARGLAFTRLNQLSNASSELQLMKKKLNAEPSLKEPLAPFNSAYNSGLVAQNILEGVIAAAQKNYAKSIELLNEAVKAEDHLVYNEPRDWLLPARHYLADVLIKAGRNNEAVTVLKQDLKISPSNGWALTGIVNTFQKSKSEEATLAKKRLKNAWLAKDVNIDNVVF